MRRMIMVMVNTLMMNEECRNDSSGLNLMALSQREVSDPVRTLTRCFAS